MTLKAHFDGKAFIPDEPVQLPAGSAVTIKIVPVNGNSLGDLVDLARKHPIEDAPADWSEQHDHYIHGASKQ